MRAYYRCVTVEPNALVQVCFSHRSEAVFGSVLTLTGWDAVYEG